MNEHEQKNAEKQFILAVFSLNIIYLQLNYKNSWQYPSRPPTKLTHSKTVPHHETQSKISFPTHKAVPLTYMNHQAQLNNFTCPHRYEKHKKQSADRQRP